jgi:hypothetical protein
MFAVIPDTYISYRLGRRYRSVLCLSFLDVYGLNTPSLKYKWY